MNSQTINIDKEILNGIPVFSGTRVPIKNLFDYLETNESIETFLEDFESVSRQQVLDVLKIFQELIHSSNKKSSRQGWEKAFKKMQRNI